MRTDAEPAGALVDDDALIAASTDDLAHVGARLEQRHDARFVAGSATAEDFEAGARGLVAQVVGELQNTLRHSVDAHFQQQLQAGAETGDAGDVERAALPAASVRFELEVDLGEVTRADHAVPADADRVQPIDQFTADVEDLG